MNRGRPPRTLEQRREHFWGLVHKTADDGCWLWQGGGDRRSGYGLVTFGVGHYRKQTTTAQRFAWYLIHGAMPDGGVDVVRTCRQRLCVAPHHLILVERGSGAHLTP